MSAKRTTMTEIILKGLLVFAILTVIQGQIFFEDVNKIWLAVVSLALIMRLMMYRYNRTQFLMLFSTVMVHVAALYFTDFPLHHFNMLFYFALWVILYVYFSKSKNMIGKVLKESDDYILFILWTWTIIVGISAVLPSSYKDRYFYSFSGNSFRLMPAVLIITALAMYMAVSRKDKRYNFFLILPAYSAFMNYSRVYFGLFILFLLMYVYMQVGSKRKFYLVLLPIMGIVLGLMSITGIADKFLSTQYTESSYFDFWGTVTNGRTVFWVWDIEAFFELPFWQQFVGNGFNFVYDVNGAKMSKIWAHNDLINILMNFGYVGVVIYCWAFSQLLKVYWPKGNKVPAMVKLMFLGAVFINSMLNMSYTYMCAMISYPLFLWVISAKYEE